jgi:hypothetical protein
MGKDRISWYVFAQELGQAELAVLFQPQKAHDQRDAEMPALGKCLFRQIHMRVASDEKANPAVEPGSFINIHVGRNGEVRSVVGKVLGGSATGAVPAELSVVHVAEYLNSEHSPRVEGRRHKKQTKCSVTF